MPGPRITLALYLLFPLASALLIHLVGSRGRSSSGGAPQETQSAKKRHRHPYWTHQRLRDHLDGKFLWLYTDFQYSADSSDPFCRPVWWPKPMVSPLGIGKAWELWLRCSVR